MKLGGQGVKNHCQDEAVWLFLLDMVNYKSLCSLCCHAVLMTSSCDMQVELPQSHKSASSLCRMTMQQDVHTGYVGIVHQIFAI